MVTGALGTSTRWALAALAGLLNGAAFIYLGPLALIANVPLLIALSAAPSATHAALLGGLVGLIGGAHIYGILHYGAWILLAFSLYTASQMVVYALILRALWGRVSPAFDVALPALVWTLSEWMRSVGPLSMPASYVGNIVDHAAFAPWLALAPHAGGLAVSTLIALTQSVVYHLAFAPRTHRRPALAATAILALVGLAGALWPPPLGDRPIRVAGVQGGLPNHAYRAATADPAAMRHVVETYERLTADAYPRADLVVWPETAVRAPVLETPSLRARLAPGPDDPPLIAGLIGRNPAGDLQNLAVALGPGGRELARQPKVRLVPGTEAHFTPGAAWAPLDTPAGRIGALICLESVYPDAGRALAAAGAELLVVMSNDAGFGRSPITRHMTDRAAVRALETGRWLLRVGQAGITTLIDPRGRRHQQLGLFQPGVLYGEARLRADRTLYVRFGDYWMLLVALALVGGAALALRRSRRDSHRSTM